MAEYPNTLWLTVFYLLLGSVLSFHGLTFEQQLKISMFDCNLNIKGTNWTTECESQDYASEATYKFFAVRLHGVLNLVSPLTYSELLNATSFKDSEFYFCDSQWRYFLNIDPSTLLYHCENYKKYLAKLILVLNESSSVSSLKVSQASKPYFVLNILSECSNLKEVIITNNSLPNLSSLPAQVNNSLMSLSLKRNEVENVTDGIFRVFPSLSSLDLSHNLLKIVRKKLFLGLEALSELDMSHNLIESISSDAFSILVSLKSIFLRNNNLKHISKDSFNYNKFMSIIDISNNDIQRLPAMLFTNKPNLKNVSCYNCGLFYLEKDMFLNSPNLVWVDFSFNHLRVIPVDMFRALSFLQYVFFSYNNISFLGENLFSNQPYLMFLNLSHNKIPTLKSGMFAGARNIRYLDLSRNKIKILTDDHIKNFTDLEYFGLDHNSIVRVELGITIPVRVRKLRISNNNIKVFNVRWKKLIYLENLYVDNNKLTSINLPPCIPSIKQTLTFSFQYNKISRVNMDALISDENRVKVDKKMAGCFFNGLAKNFVDLTHNPLICDCKLYPFYEYVRKKAPRKYQLEMFIDKGNLTCADPPLLNNSSLISLPDDIMSCPLPKERCPLFCRCGLRGKDSLIFVNCSSGNLTEVPQSVPDGTTVLYVNRNRLSTMTTLNTNAWRDLRELHIDNNLLTGLDGWNFPPSLRYLSVRGNKLKTLPYPLMQFISNLTEFQLFFGNNDQDCDCDREGLKKFLLHNIDFVQDNEDILCVVTNNGTSGLLPLTSVPDSNLCPQTSDNLNYHQKRLIIALCVSFTILIVLVLVYYRQRQLILSFFYIHCEDLFRLFYFEDSDDDDKIFDAFVAYSSSDRETVLKLLDELENNPPYFRLCIHERNWLPGRFITDNIVNSVEGSRRTIVILSNTFISSPWFNLELRAAVFKMSKNKMSRIIVILADKSVSLDSIDSEIRHVISKRTYLVWGERWFWEKLRYAMPRKRDVKCVLRNVPTHASMSEAALMPETT